MYRMKNLATRTWLPLLVCLAFAVEGVAAPTTDAPSREAEATGGRPAALPDMAADADGQGNSKTVRMLLELQNAPPPLEGTGGDPRRNDAKSKHTAARAAAEADAVVAPAAERPQAGTVDWRSGLPGRTVNSQRSDVTTSVVGREGSSNTRAAPQRADDRVDFKALLPAQVVAFLRENREWVLLASLGLLGMVWLAASALSQRRR